MSQLDTERPVTVYAENIGGLSESEVTLQPGVTVLRIHRYRPFRVELAHTPAIRQG